jgi:RNA polymerase sigma factor (TIGR02999 family)
MSTYPDITTMLRSAADGNREAVDALFAVVYEHLRQLARRERTRWTGDYTLDTTALVHEAYLKLVNQDNHDWRDRAHFLAVAAKAMRQILVNYAERRCAAKRGGGAVVLELSEANPVAPEVAEEIVALNEALDRLREAAERASRVVECRFFAGLTVPETAEALGVSPVTVKRDWAWASAWLYRELGASVGRLGTLE